MIVKNKLNAYFKYLSKPAYSTLFAKVFINGRSVSNNLIECTIVVRISLTFGHLNFRITTDFEIQPSADLSKDVF